IRKMERAAELWDLSEAIMRQNLRRRNPEASEEEIEDLFRAWLHERPGAEHGDASGPSFRVGTRDFGV
ncbi:MAG TPA: hypothetical protein VKU40_18910, partial [Thermoanaerobaculia bacterium]|nr:hypothetical protein [Thermoanaerobaculia bacterium]